MALFFLELSAIHVKIDSSVNILEVVILNNAGEEDIRNRCLPILLT
jgi:hypothetical protein